MKMGKELDMESKVPPAINVGDAVYCQGQKAEVVAAPKASEPIPIKAGRALFNERRWPTAEEMEREQQIRRMVDYATACKPVIDILLRLEMLRGFVLTRDADGTETITATYPPEVEVSRQNAIECLRMIGKHYGIPEPIKDQAIYSYSSAVDDLAAYRRRFGL